MTSAIDVTGERELRALLRAAPGLTVVTGGQTGVDTYGALAALRVGLPTHLVYPQGYRQEDGALTPVRRRRLSGAVLHELGSASFRYRTWTCVYLADVVVLLDPAGGSGCQETVLAARKLGRPLLAPEPGRISSAQVADWLTDTAARLLLVAGCRASVLARKGNGRGVRADLAAVIAGARQQHERLLGPGGLGDAS
jgi:Circularly permutated YpsA SLOG family